MPVNQKQYKNMTNEPDMFNDMTREQRTAHIDLNDNCIFSNSENSRGQRKAAKRKLSNYFDIVTRKMSNTGWEVCHLCQNNSNVPRHGGSVCINPLHMYWGTKSENTQDRKK